MDVAQLQAQGTELVSQINQNDGLDLTELATGGGGLMGLLSNPQQLVTAAAELQQQAAMVGQLLANFHQRLTVLEEAQNGKVTK